MNNIEIRIYNPALELQGIIDEFSSLIWIRRYQAPGEFELRTPYSAESKGLLVPENIVQKFDGVDNSAGVIENIVLNSNEIVVKGRFLECYLDRRITRSLTTIYFTNVTAEYAMRAIVQNYADFSLLELGDDHGLTEELDFQVTHKCILNIIQKVCKATGLGFRIRPDFSARKMYFEVYKGVDRTASSADKVIFSETYDNLLNEQYTYDSTNFATRAITTQVIDDVRYIYPVGDTGLDRYEIHVSTSVDVDGHTQAQIKAAMEREGQMALNSRTISESFTFTTDAEKPFKYRTDYDLGDLVLIKHNAWGIDLSLRAAEIEEDYKDGGVDVVITSGSQMPETIDFEEV